MTLELIEGGLISIKTKAVCPYCGQLVLVKVKSESVSNFDIMSIFTFKLPPSRKARRVMRACLSCGEDFMVTLEDECDQV